MAMTAQFEIASCVRVQGKLKESLQLLEKTLHLSESRYPDPKSKSLSIGFAYLRKGLIYLEWNDLQEALHWALEGLRICKSWGYSDYLWNGWRIYANILYESGDLDGALKAIDEAKQIFPVVSPGDRILALEAVIRLARGDLASAAAWVEQMDLGLDDTPDIAQREDYLQYARILMAQGKLDEAYQILERLRVATEGMGEITRLLNILTWQIVILQAKGDEEAALSLLQRALPLAEPGGFVRIFINKGAGMAQLLHKAAAAGICADYARKLWEEYRNSLGGAVLVKPPSGPAEDRKTPATLVEPISQRELEILRLLGSSLSGSEIAEELYISVNTVRTHIKNIYRKLEVNGRMEAFRRAQDLGLI